MENIKTKILLYVKHKYHQLLIAKELQSCIDNITISFTESQLETKKCLENKPIDFLIVDIDSSDRENLYLMQQYKTKNQNLKIIALVKNNTESFLKSLFNSGVSEVLQKNENFYACIPKLISKLIESELLLNPQANSLNTLIFDEINKPLMTILSLTEFILHDKLELDKQLIKKIQVIQKSAFQIYQKTHQFSGKNSLSYLKNQTQENNTTKTSRIKTISKV